MLNEKELQCMVTDMVNAWVDYKNNIEYKNVLYEPPVTTVFQSRNLFLSDLISQNSFCEGGRDCVWKTLVVNALLLTLITKEQFIKDNGSWPGLNLKSVKSALDYAHQEVNSEKLPTFETPRDLCEYLLTHNYSPFFFTGVCKWAVALEKVWVENRDVFTPPVTPQPNIYSVQPRSNVQFPEEMGLISWAGQKDDLVSSAEEALTNLAKKGDTEAIYHMLKPMKSKEDLELWHYEEDDEGEDVLSLANDNDEWAMEQVNKRRPVVEHVMQQINPEKIYIAIIPFYQDIVCDFVKGSDMEMYLYNLSLDADELEISTTVDYDDQKVFICEYNPIKPL